ncbi:MBL fold metallo-hydrolase [Halobacillus seohaensis]|uniref:MBL fold metallo-hydrolase n=1 Tax=Halobacillus seohaensis TaxID=447421 RepID=A0ABW2EQL1_9BACI
MFKHPFLVFFSVVAIVLSGGCGEGSPGSTDEQAQQEEQTEQVETEKQAENSTNSSDSDGDAELEAKEESIENEEDVDDQSASSEEEQTEETELTSELTAHYINVGQADATLLEFQDNGQPFHILVDAGDWNSDNVVNYLDSQDIDQIDIAVGTHPDADHIGQLDQVIKQFNVDEVWMSGNESTSDTYARVMDMIEVSGAELEEPRAGDTFDIGALEVDVLYPEAVTGQTNQESISLKMSYGEVDFIFTGDAETGDESQMINGETNLDTEILQLGHHGSSTSTSSAFLERVNPEVAIYSAGADNQYGHPNAEVVNRVQDAGIDLYGTDVHGTIEVTTNGESYQIATREDGTITPSSSSNEKDSSQETDSEPEREEASGACIDINSASVEKVQEITQIGPARAEDLIDLRPFNSIDDLTDISGIGPARIDDIKAQGIACVGG